MKFFLKSHKWLGIVASFFIIIFSLSGIFLNHRQAIAKFDISRSLLPDTYNYKNWNNSAIKGSRKLGSDSILVYGGAGIWLSDSAHTSFTPYMDGMLTGADNRNTINIIETKNKEVFLITTFDLYQLDRPNNKWIQLTKELKTDERLADIACKGDFLVVITRSNSYTATFPYSSFEKRELAARKGYQKKVPLFRLMWTLHSGELFGIVGKLFVDFIGLLFIVLSLTGVIILFFPRIIRKRKAIKSKKKLASFLKGNLKWHNKLGSWFLIFGLVVIISGIFLRPPAMILIIRDKVAPPPGTIQDTDNPWFEKLRNLRYDDHKGEWLMYTSDGFFSMEHLSSEPQSIQNTPMISVMGINVMEQIAPALWVVGSFNGLYYWDRNSGMIADVAKMRSIFHKDQKIEGSLIETQRGIMSGIDISGYSNDFIGKEIVFSYSVGALYIGTSPQFAEMPDEVKASKISLWHASLEAHVGRIYTPIVNGILGESLFVLLSGLIILFIYISGYIVYKTKYKKRKNNLNHK